MSTINSPVRKHRQTVHYGMMKSSFASNDIKYIFVLFKFKPPLCITNLTQLFDLHEIMKNETVSHRSRIVTKKSNIYIWTWRALLTHVKTPLNHICFWNAKSPKKKREKTFLFLLPSDFFLAHVLRRTLTKSSNFGQTKKKLETEWLHFTVTVDSANNLFYLLSTPSNYSWFARAMKKKREPQLHSTCATIEHENVWNIFAQIFVRLHRETHREFKNNNNNENRFEFALQIFFKVIFAW